MPCSRRDLFKRAAAVGIAVVATDDLDALVRALTRRATYQLDATMVAPARALTRRATYQLDATMVALALSAGRLVSSRCAVGIVTGDNGYLPDEEVLVLDRYAMTLAPGRPVSLIAGEIVFPGDVVAVGADGRVYRAG